MPKTERGFFIPLLFISIIALSFAAIYFLKYKYPEFLKNYEYSETTQPENETQKNGQKTTSPTSSQSKNTNKNTPTLKPSSPSITTFESSQTQTSTPTNTPTPTSTQPDGGGNNNDKGKDSFVGG